MNRDKIIEKILDDVFFSKKRVDEAKQEILAIFKSALKQVLEGLRMKKKRIHRMPVFDNLVNTINAGNEGFNQAVSEFNSKIDKLEGEKWELNEEKLLESAEEVRKVLIKEGKIK